ncbi:hypothetical protein BJV82DRAFT_509449, partial [Fennellomyces sp. T-0311]
LDKDGVIHPQLRYCTSQLLAGAILVDGGTSIVINTVEPYSRDTLLDAHHERRLASAASSYPTAPTRSGYLSICTLTTPDGKKLVIGSHTCNFLITSSIRLDMRSTSYRPCDYTLQPLK